jgi:hypothetical protein
MSMSFNDSMELVATAKLGEMSAIQFFNPPAEEKL